MTNKHILYILFLVCISRSLLAAARESTAAPKTDRKIRVLVYPFESDLPEAYNTYLKLKIKTTLYASKKYELVEKDEKKLREDIAYAKKKWQCKDTAQTVRILATIAHFDHLTAFFKDTSHRLADDIKNKYIKPDIFLEWELSASLAYAYNTGRLQAFLSNGWGALLEVRGYGLYRNLFLKADVGVFQFSGAQYASDTAYFLPFDLGAGYKARLGNTHFALSPSFGLGALLIIMRSGAHNDIEKRGLLPHEHATEHFVDPFGSIGCTLEYEWHALRIFAGLFDNAYREKRTIFNQVVVSLGLMYMF